MTRRDAEAVDRVLPEAASRLRMIREVCPAPVFNALRDRLPRAARRDVLSIPAGHVGLVVQAIGEPDVPLATAYGQLPAGTDPTQALADLEAELLQRLR